jgi:predicted alpha/beta-hydrolase family hydrolase
VDSETPSTSNSEPFWDASRLPPVHGFIHSTARPPGGGLVLTHGAGSNCRAPLLVALADAWASAGFVVLRCDLPFRHERPHGPPRPADAERDRAGLSNAVTSMRNACFRTPGVERIFLGGHSYGGRQATMLAAAEPDLAAGLLLFSYPLHPPGKPAQLRVQHLPQLHVPALFVHGTRDPFGSIAEMERALKLIPAKTELQSVEAAGHDLGCKGKSVPDRLPGEVLAAFQKFFA